MKVSKLFLELIIVLFKLNESVRLLDDSDEPGNSLPHGRLWWWGYWLCLVWFDEPPVPGVDSAMHSLKTVGSAIWGWALDYFSWDPDDLVWIKLDHHFLRLF